MRRKTTRRPLSVRPSDSNEAYADDFAMNLLMPENEVRQMHRKGANWIDLVARFGVPQEIAVRRLRELGLM